MKHASISWKYLGTSEWFILDIRKQRVNKKEDLNELSDEPETNLLIHVK